MAATEIWTNAAGVDGYIRILGNVETGKITGIQCCDAIDLSNYDNTNYRDDFFSTGQAGDPGSLVAKLGQIAPADAVVLGDEAGTLTTAAIAADLISINDQATHIPPRNEVKKSTILRFWSGPFTAGKGTGNVLFSCPYEQFIALSATPFQFI